MGNLLSCRVADVGMVVLSDGRVRPLDGPTPVAELMLEHPREFVVDLQHASTAADGTNCVTPLPADHLMEPDKVYAMLPMAPGQAAARLSAMEARQVLAVAKQLAKPARSSLIGALLGGRPKEVAIAIGPGPGKEKGKVVVMDQEEAYADDREVTDHRWWSDQEVLMRQYSSRSWKPSLDTIVERSLEKQKVPHWLF